ncbi:netrin-4 isoform X2 [Triplophysa dalaica]|uniref:netrin-4 isoform X2 n=1 Tax=Triplophysa dalaica TaxID=1582913 RepID=UPI0024DF317D|nr:netrin-4 isoform X2 [Triplophysa dalaica]
MELTGRCVFFAALVISVPHPARSGCENRVCNPRMGNLAVGRPVRTISQCGLKSLERYCHYTMDRCVPHCEVCDASVTHLAHPPASMTDSPFKHPQTWWQSAQGITIETLQLDLEVEFYFTHLIIIFRSPRPGAMAIERSQDFGHTWSALRLYAHNCSEVFNLEDGHRCTEKYSTALPCSNGEVIYRALSPWDKLDPYSITAQAHLSITNIRVHLLQPQSCPCQHKFPDANFATAHYAIYDLISKGGCLCHGHADHCVPAGDQQIKHLPNKHMVHGKCVCRHHTAGDHCEKCERLYNDQPWKPANGLTGQAHQCVKCKCNGHAESCHLDETVWLRSGQRSGGVCDCLHNTSGRQCQHCKSGFYRDPERPPTEPDSCTSCMCNRVGSTFCNPDNGDCVCKPGVAGSHCDHCRMGYWGFDEYGCKPCQCGSNCDPYTGDCLNRSESDFNSRENNLFRKEELFSALSHPDKCVCKQQPLGNSKAFCNMKKDYAVKVRVLGAHDKGSHAEVDVQILKVLWDNIGISHSPGNVTLYPESWTLRGCTCPVLYPDSWNEFKHDNLANTQWMGQSFVNECLVNSVEICRAFLGFL